MTFSGWPTGAVDFFDGLEDDNSKAYWQEHRSTYDAAVRAPMDALLAELAPEFGEAKVFRPYRDVRFSADKTPYKTAIGASMEHGYVQFSAAGLAVGCGYYEMASDQLARYRKAVADDASGAELEALVADARSHGMEVNARESLRTAPRGYPQDHPRIELLRYKGLITWREWPVGKWLSTPQAKDRVVEFLRASRPLQAWLDSHVGASAQR